VRQEKKVVIVIFEQTTSNNNIKQSATNSARAQISSASCSYRSVVLPPFCDVFSSFSFPFATNLFLLFCF